MKWILKWVMKIMGYLDIYSVLSPYQKEAPQDIFESNSQQSRGEYLEGDLFVSGGIRARTA
jgi:hypothetical protein